MSLSAKPKVLLLKKEATYKTDAAPTGADNAYLIRDDPSFAPLRMDLVERSNAKASFGHNQQLSAAEYRTISFSTELAGSGVAGTAPAWADAMLACAMSMTVSAGVDVVFAPVSTVTDSATIHFWRGGKRYVMLGARGTYTLTTDAKQIPLIQWEFTGLCAPVGDITDAAYPVIDLTAWQAPLVVNYQNTPTFSLFGYGDGSLYAFSLQAGNQVVHRNIPGANDVLITDALPEGSITISEPTLAAQDYFTAIRQGTLGNVQIVHGTQAGNIITIDVSDVSLGEPSHGDQDNVLTLQVPFRVSGRATLTLT